MNAVRTRERPATRDAWGRGAVLAVLVHVGLLVALAFGVHWRSRTTAAAEAELWSAVPQAAAPRVEPPPPAPEPKPEPKPAPPPPPPKPAEPTREQREAELAIEKAKQEKLLREQQERERLEKEKQREREREAEERRQAEEKRKLEERRKAEEQKRREQAEREAREKKEAERREAAEQALREKARKEQMARIAAMAGGTGGPNSTGTAARSSGPSSGYAGRVVAAVKPNIVFPDDPPGNPTAEVEVRAAPDGTITARRLVKSSGVKAWDDAVLRAIDRTSMLPRDVDGRVPSPLVIEFRVRD